MDGRYFAEEDGRILNESDAQKMEAGARSCSQSSSPRLSFETMRHANARACDIIPDSIDRACWRLGAHGPPL